MLVTSLSPWYAGAPREFDEILSCWLAPFVTRSFDHVLVSVAEMPSSESATRSPIAELVGALTMAAVASRCRASLPGKPLLQTEDDDTRAVSEPASAA